ncbi:fluoride efflux transporter CrcB [Edaphobacter bradus]|uniref:fluoride efflux transporter CrcB n=1 Tax=Edaphobacter bradus TaxID=2259016 RepID=UPI0021DFB642|nr:fluoride efflux transporter CrcB [Edaphobacter bradus]
MRQIIMTYLWIALGSALGGVLRYAITRATLNIDNGFPYGTVLINIIGCFVIGFFGTLTLHGDRYSVPDHIRLFVMVGICGGFTTFSSFSLQTFDLMRSGAWGRALANVVASVVLCFLSVAAGHMAAHRAVAREEIAQNRVEEYTG